jgi:hypothetical protein
VYDQYPADVLHRLGRGAAAYLLEHALAFGAIRACDADLDELVALERALDLLKNRRREAGLAHPHHRIERVGAGTQSSSLFGIHRGRGGFGKRHSRDIE